MGAVPVDMDAVVVVAVPVVVVVLDDVAAA